MSYPGKVKGGNMDDNQLVLHGLIEKEKDRFVALCLELDVASEGNTIEEAESNLKEAVSGYLISVFENGLQDELFPRLAPREDWGKFFSAEMKKRHYSVHPKEIRLLKTSYA